MHSARHKVITLHLLGYSRALSGETNFGSLAWCEAKRASSLHDTLLYYNPAPMITSHTQNATRYQKSHVTVFDSGCTSDDTNFV